MIKIEIKMPKNCEECGFICNEEHECVIMRKINRNKDAHVWDYEKTGEKPDWCPLKKV